MCIKRGITPGTQELLRNGELHEVILENQGNGIARTNQTNNERAEALMELEESRRKRPCTERTWEQWVQWCRTNWKWIAFCTVFIVSVFIGIGVGIGIPIGMYLHQNNVTVCPNSKTFGKVSEVSDGWVCYNGHQYYFSEEVRNWTYSIKYCEEHEAVLAVLDDNDVKENVKRFKKHTDNQWCGGYQENGKQKWLNKVLGENERLKNISGPNCLTWNPDELYLNDCAVKKTFICIK